MSNMVNEKGETVKEKVRVTTDKLKEKSSEWEEIAKAAGKDLRKAGTTMENIQASFYAKPIVFIQKAFGQLIEEGCRQMEELCDHIKKLSRIAESYEEAERENELAVKDN